MAGEWFAWWRWDRADITKGTVSDVGQKSAICTQRYTQHLLTQLNIILLGIMQGSLIQNSKRQVSQSIILQICIYDFKTQAKLSFSFQQNISSLQIPHSATDVIHKFQLLNTMTTNATLNRISRTGKRNIFYNLSVWSLWTWTRVCTPYTVWKTTTAPWSVVTVNLF